MGLLESKGYKCWFPGLKDYSHSVSETTAGGGVSSWVYNKLYDLEQE